jgi:hypothetical protein
MPDASAQVMVSSPSRPIKHGASAAHPSASPPSAICNGGVVVVVHLTACHQQQQQQLQTPGAKPMQKFATPRPAAHHTVL